MEIEALPDPLAELQEKELSQDELFIPCGQCSQYFVAQYWDEELEWYIDMLHGDLCATCRSFNQQEVNLRPH